MTQRLRIFISSPSDVQEERLRANLVVQKLARDYARFFKLEAYLWEHEPMLASGHFQDAIEPPSACDIVILIVYSRIGVALPEHSGTRAYRGIDGRAPVTGTEWEFEEALAAHRASGTPDLLAYRKLGDPGTSLADPVRRVEQERQWNALQDFWRRHFETGKIFLAGSATFNTLDEFDRKLESDLVTLIERRITHGLEASSQGDQAIWLKGSPFRGLSSYDFDDAPIFFGRDGAIRASLTRLQQAAGRGSAFLLLLGASGSGKSSVARAGILPALFAPKAVPGVAIWRRVVFRPGEGDPDPIVGLARALCTTDATGDVGLPELGSSPEDIARLANHLAASAEDASYPVRQALQRIRDEKQRRKGVLPHETAQLVILVDQLEELLTRPIDPERRALFVRILAGLAKSGCVWVVATMRNDLWHRAAEVPQLLSLIEAGARVDLPHPDNAQVIEIIRRSAAAAGLTFETDVESGLALDAVVARAAAEEPGALPLLSVLLESLYQRDILQRSQDAARPHQLRFATYRELGELHGAIARRAEEVLEALALSDPAAVGAFPRVLRALVTASAQGGSVTSRPARIEQFSEGGPEARLIAALLAPQARLLVISMADQSAEVRLAHEALIGNWPRARDQIARDQRDLETRARLEALLRRWNGAASAAERKLAILTGLNLAEGSDLVQRWQDEAGADLKGFVAASQQADAWRRRRSLIAAAVLIGVFAAISAIASLQWRRAESEAELALRARQTEAQARAVAETERARAVANEQRAAEALRATRRETAQTLAAQVQLSLRQNDVRGALALAIQAAHTERDALAPTDRAASEPALLQALGQVREVLHIKGAAQGFWLPFAFLDDATLVYADAKAGLARVDLRNAKQTSRIALGEPKPVNQLAAAPALGIVALAIGDELVLVDLRAEIVKTRIPLAARINSIDIDPTQGTIAASAGQRVSLIESSSGQATVLDSPPGIPANVMAGQVRFAQSGTRMLATYGATIFEYDVARRSLIGTAGTLSGTGLGADQATINSVLANGMVPFVRLTPDLDDSSQVFTVAPLELQAIDTRSGVARRLQGEDRSLEFHGVGALDPERKGRASAMAAVMSRAREGGRELQLRYVSGRDGLVLTNEQRLQPAFDSFAIAPGDFANQKPGTCKMSPSATFVACQYWTKETQGIVAWRASAGTHGLERIAERYNASSGVFTDDRRLLVASNDGLLALGTPGETKVGDLSPEWTLVAAQGRFVLAQSPGNGTAQILRQDNDRFVPASEVFKATAVRPVKGQDRALVQDAERLSLRDLASGSTIWTAPIGDLQTAASGNNGQAVAVAETAVYLLDIESGRILKSFPLAQAPESPVAIDPIGSKVAYVGRDKIVTTLDLSSGETAAVADRAATATQLAWSNDASLLLIGRTDGSVLAWNAAGKPEWLIPSPFEKSFQASAWPGQPAQGVVLQIAASRDGRRFTVIRQDISQIDIHEVGTGRLLTRLAAPSSTLKVPAHVTFGPDDEILSAWAFHAMTRDKPRFVSVHRLPRSFEEALAAATAQLERLNRPWSPEGPAR